MQRTESAEGKDNRAKPCSVVSAEMPPQEQLHPEQHERITQQNLEIERSRQRQAAIQQQMQRMIGTSLTRSRQKEAAEESRHPVKGITIRQTLSVKLTNRKVVILQVIPDIDTPGEQGKKHPRQQCKRSPFCGLCLCRLQCQRIRR